MSDALLVRPQRFQDESEHGHLLRLAHVNGLDKLSWLYPFYPDMRSHHGVWSVCPSCLNESEPYWRMAWVDRAQPFCDRHRVRLCDVCQACDSGLQSSRVGLTSCRCGQRLCEMQSQPMSDELVCALDGAVADINVLLWLGALSMFGPVGKPLKKASSKRANVRAGLLEEGARIALDWPAAFDEVLERHRVQSGSGAVQLLQTAWPRLPKLLAEIRDARWRSRVQQAIESHVQGSRRSASPLLTRSPIAPSGRFNLRALANETGVKFENLVRELDTRQATSLPRRTEGLRLRRAPTVEEIGAAAKAIKDRMPAKSAAKLLGLSVPRLAEVCKAGHLTISGSSVSSAAASAFLMRQRQQVMPSIATSGMTYPTFLRLHVPLTCTAVFLKLLFEGEIAIHAPTPASPPNEWRLTVETAKKVVGMLKTLKSADFTIGEAAAQLGIKEQVAYQLVAAGHLRTRVSPRSGTRGRRVSPQELEDFRVRLTPLSEVARHAGLSVKAVRHWLPSSGLEVICGPGTNGLRQYFVSTTSARRFLDAGGRIQS